MVRPSQTNGKSVPLPPGTRLKSNLFFCASQSDKRLFCLLILELVEDGVTLNLCVVDTPGFADGMNREHK